MNKSELRNNPAIVALLESGALKDIASYLRANNPYTRGNFLPTEGALQNNGAAIGFEKAVGELLAIAATDTAEERPNIHYYQNAQPTK